MIRRLIGCVGVLAYCATGGAQEYTVLKTFSGSDGNGPMGGVIVIGDKMYGMTQTRSLGAGTIFSMGTNGTSFTNLHLFPSYTATDGAAPYGDLLQIGNTLFGMTRNGGANSPSSGSGTVFRVDMDGSNFTLLHNFSDGSGGKNPTGNLTLLGDSFWGLTSDGGVSNGGTIFRMGTNGTGFTVVHEFYSSRGSMPYGELVQVNDRFYGTASYQGSNGNGVVFSIGTNGGDYQVIHYFRGGLGDGSRPMGSLMEADGVLYGVTSDGGSNSNYGTVFRLDPDGTDFEILHDFAGGNNDGRDPQYVDLTFFNGAIYGMTQYGGTNLNAGQGYGTLWSMSTNGAEFLVLHRFTGGSADGRLPFNGSLELADGVLYGMTTYGGPSDVGTIFSYVIPEVKVWVGLAGFGAVLVLRCRRRRGAVNR